MSNLKLEIEYDGTNYCGWQVQNHCQRTCAPKHQRKSIQEIIEKALREILREEIKLTASGRTDAGVHALAQIANFKTESKISCAQLQLGLNALLPEDIVITKIDKMPVDFHSRFSALSKVYRYTILNRKHRASLTRHTYYQCAYPLDVNLMRNEAKALVGKHDFSAFCASAGKKKNPLKTLKRIKIKKEGDFIYIDIEADGFLYNMVRNIAGTLIDIGRGRLPRGSIKKILLSKNRKLAGPTAPAKGLCLVKVKY